MGSLRMCCIAPHAPILVPEVGRRELARVEGTCAGLETLARQIEELNPGTVVAVSPPHTGPVRRDSFRIRTGERLRGSLERFGAPGARVDMRIDRDLTGILIENAASLGVKCFEDNAEGEDDWGLLVPLILLAPAGCGLVSLNVAPHLPYTRHHSLGKAIASSLRDYGRDTVFLGSGDMSHRLTRSAPAGYHPRGKDFDREVVEIIASGELRDLMGIDPGLVDAAGEDCLWSAVTLAGVLDGRDYESEVLSYEGPFGVGYMVARFIPLNSRSGAGTDEQGEGGESADR